MGGMETWLMGETYPGYMVALVPMAAEPAAISKRPVQSLVSEHWTSC